MSASSLPLPQGKSVSLKQFVSRHINEIGLLVVIAHSLSGLLPERAGLYLIE